jgi:hypothetical protein
VVAASFQSVLFHSHVSPPAPPRAAKDHEHAARVVERAGDAEGGAGTAAGPRRARRRRAAARALRDGPQRADLYAQHAASCWGRGRFDRSSWQKQAKVLTDAGFRVLAIDFRAAVQARTGSEPVCSHVAMLAVGR